MSKGGDFTSDFVIAKNQDYTIARDNGVNVTVSDVFSRINTFRRKVVISPGKGKGKIEPIYITFISSSFQNIYEQMRSKPASVNGTFTVETGGQIILKIAIKDGVFGTADNIAYRVPDPRYNASVPCTVTTIHNCVSWEIESMNWIEYGACLASAPGCYAALWASCTWEVCHNHMQYTNPIN